MVRERVLLRGLPGPAPHCLLSLELIRPPYNEPETWSWVPVSDLSWGSGALLTLRLSVDSGWEAELRNFIGRFKRAYPGVPIVVLVPHTSFISPRLFRFLQSGNMPFGAEVCRGGYERDTYREKVCEWPPPTLEEWLGELFPPSSMADLGCISCIVGILTAHAPGVPGRQEAFRRRLLGLRLPTPHRWRMVSQAIPAVLSMQLGVLTVPEAARLGGYSEPSSFRRHCGTLFSSPPSSLRLRWGWEVLLARFLKLI
jgi:hypothetical protein